MMYENTLLSRIVDADELKMNEGREGMFFGTKNFITKPIGIFYLTRLLGVYLIDSTSPSVTSLNSMKIILFGWPIFVVSLCLIIFLKFPLKGEKLVEIKKLVRKKHKKT